MDEDNVRNSARNVQLINEIVLRCSVGDECNESELSRLKGGEEVMRGAGNGGKIGR